MFASIHSPYMLFHVDHTLVAVRKNQMGAKTLMSYILYQPQRLLITIISDNSSKFSTFLFLLRGDVIEIMAYPT